MIHQSNILLSKYELYWKIKDMRFYFSYENVVEDPSMAVEEQLSRSSSSESEEPGPFVVVRRAGRITTHRRGRGRGRSGRRRSRVQTRGGRGQARRRAAPQAQSANATATEPHHGYNDPDTGNTFLAFTPNRQPGLHLSGPLTRGAMTTALDFFKLFFTVELIQQVCKHTNEYGWLVIEKKQYYPAKSGAWIDTSPEEINKLIALILYMGIVRVSSFHRYWSTKSLYHGLWARSMLSRDRFKALNIVDPAEENPANKLRKVQSFIDSFRKTCKILYQSSQKVAKVVKSKHRSGIRQYIKNKPVKFGIKLWVIADSVNGYTYDFDVYAGRNAGHDEPSENGLGYDIVTKLSQPLLNQGYHLFSDNFYSSVTLVKDPFST